jgi:hypothetical protein
MTPREDFLRKFNDAFVTNDTDFIVNQLADDVEWDMVGDHKIIGKEKVREAMQAMSGSMKVLAMHIEKYIIHDGEAAVNGTMNMLDKGNEITFGFCDVYTFSEDNSEKIKAMTSYVVPLKK